MLPKDGLDCPAAAQPVARTCTLFGCAIIHMNVILPSVVMRCGWGSREVNVCCLPVCTASRGTSRVGLGVLAGVTSSKIGSRFKEPPFFSLIDTVLTCICHVMFVYDVLLNLGGVGLGFF